MDQEDDDDSSSEVIFQVPQRRDGIIFSRLMQQEAAPTENQAIEIIDFENAVAEMQKQWMKLYTNNILNCKVIDPDQYSETIWRHLLLIQDVKGYLLLHHACRKKASLDTIKWLIGDENDVLTLSHKAMDGCLPIHIVCRSYPSLEVVKLVSKDSSGRNFLNVPDGNGDFPLDLVGDGDGIAENRVVRFLVENCPAVHEFTATMVEELLNDEHGDREGIFQAMDSICNNCPPKKFQKIVRNNLKSRICIDWLTWSFCQRNVIFSVMRDFYCQVAWIALLFHASSLYLNSQSPDYFVYPLYFFAAVFLAKEIRQLRRYARADVLISYVNGIWNWLDWMTIMLVIGSAVSLQLVDPINKPYDNAIRKLLMATGTCQVMHFASFLKKIFLPFATFVGGLTTVFKTIVPFMVCSALVLLAFAFMYYVDRFGTDSIENDRFLVTRGNDSDNGLVFTTIWVSFRSTFHMFLEAPEKTEDLLDALFGIITNIILLNVVIAVVSIAWDKSSEEEKAQQVFWEYRLTFIQDVNLSHKAKHTSRGSLGGSRSGSRRLNRSRSKAKARLVEGSRNGGLWLHFQYALQYTIYFILGLFSFGLLWPSKIKRDIFGIKFKDLEDGSKAELLETRRYQDTVTKKMNELDVKVHQQIEDNRLLIKENHNLNRKIDRFELSIEKLQILLTQLVPLDSSASGQTDAIQQPLHSQPLPPPSKRIRPANRNLPNIPDDDDDDEEEPLNRRSSRQPSEGIRPTQQIRRVRLPPIPDDDDDETRSNPSARRPSEGRRRSPHLRSMQPPPTVARNARNGRSNDEPLTPRSLRHLSEGLRRPPQRSRSQDSDDSGIIEWL